MFFHVPVNTPPTQATPLAVDDGATGFRLEPAIVPPLDISDVEMFLHTHTVPTGNAELVGIGA